MEIKEWSYKDFPEFRESVEGAVYLGTSGNEQGVRCMADIEYETEGGVRHIQMLKPYTRNSMNEEVISQRKYPCVVFVQGSAWMEQEVYSQIPLVSKLAEYGYVVAIVEIRHSGVASFPAQSIDTRNAIRFIRKHSEKYEIDPEKIIVMGDSSGGHTAVFAGLIHDDDLKSNCYPGISAEVKGIVNYYGSVSVMLEDSNPTTLNHHMPDSPEGMEMGKVNLLEHPELRRKLSAECNITPETKIAPMLIIHGTKDRIVNTRVSVLLYRRMKECKKDVQLYLLRGADHGGAEFWTKEILGIVNQFILNCIK